MGRQTVYNCPCTSVISIRAQMHKKNEDICGSRANYIRNGFAWHGGITTYDYQSSG